ncbi:MAG: PQQ-binding-like beta-propeller repeat protein [Phycisphaerae bacterium]|nr:PQQ-binding-like beta-propeller repeat protein [Phycisphaerae bacterium]
MSNRLCFLMLQLVSVVLVSPAVGVAADWPMWRYDARRSAVSPESLPAMLHLEWVVELPRLEKAWQEQPGDSRLTFDEGYAPIVLGRTVFVGSSRNDSVSALDLETGEVRWRFHADGPVRFAPAGWKDKVYFVSDDGWLTCLDAATGKVCWRVRGGASARKVLGNGRMISAWPARGAPVVVDGVVYFAASIWPFMGVFIHAVDAATGKEVWVNDGLGSLYVLQPHDSPAFAGPAPQGYLTVSEDRLLIPSGRSVPACLDRKTGAYLYYYLGTNKKLGGYDVTATGAHFVNAGEVYELDRGRHLGTVGRDAVVTEDVAYVGSGETIRALDLKHPKTTKIGGGLFGKSKTLWVLPATWELKTGGAHRVHIKAGSRLYAGGAGSVIAVDFRTDGGKPKVSWRAKVDGTPFSMIAGGGKLIVVTLEGGILCYGGRAGECRRHVRSESSPAAADHWRETAKDILGRTGVAEGYCLAVGVGSGRLIEEIARQSKLHVIGVDRDADRVESLRRRLDAAGLYGTRIALLAGGLDEVELPPYFASLVVSEEGIAIGEGAGALIERVYASMRPYGGEACLRVPAGDQGKLAKAVGDAGLANAKLTWDGGWGILRREGALPGSADWTHQYADAANSCVSKDKLVRAPLGLLWFGGPSNAKLLPRHGHGPTEHVVGGRLIIEGPNHLRALDVYTGRLLWETELGGLGRVYDNTGHQPGANALGSNYVSVSDAIYVIHGEGCLRLDPATGKKVGEFRVPRGPGGRGWAEWGMVAVWEDLLIAGVSPLSVHGESKPKDLKESYDGTSSGRLVVMDRHTGQEKWTVEAGVGFRHNAICVGGGTVFCIDGQSSRALAALRRRGAVPRAGAKAALQAFDARTGEKRWSTTKDVFGTWLSYSEAHDVLVEGGRASRDMVPDEPYKRLIAYRGRDGSILFDKRVTYGGPIMLHGKQIIAQDGALSPQCVAFDLLTGAEIKRVNPLTGGEIQWKCYRNYGCNTAIASEHLITFRSAAAGYYDLTTLGGTGNFGGFKSGCTSNLIAANGVLNAPDYTRTCACSYQNQCSVGLVHMPEVETWTFSTLGVDDARIDRIGLNLGAPGDRMASGGTLWLEYPFVGGRSPRFPIETTPLDPTWFRRHSSRVVGGEHSWVAASGCVGLAELKITLARKAKGARRYTVRLVFADPTESEAGRRVFDVSLQGKGVLSGLDVAKEAGGRLREVVKEFTGVEVKDVLVVGLSPKTDVPAFLCGVEAVEEGRTK